MANTEERRVDPPSYRHVLVPLDGSELADVAVGWAEALASRFGAEVHTITVAGNQSEAERLGAHAAEVLGTDAGDERIHVVVADDVPAEIERRCEELGSCLVCMSTRGHGRIAGAAVGSVARSVLLRGGEPVVAVGRSAEPAPPAAWLPSDTAVEAPIVACVDGAPPSESIIGAGAAWAKALGVPLTAVTVAEPSPPPVRADVRWRRSHGPAQDADAYMRDLARRWEDVAPGMEAVAVYDPLSPAAGLETWLDEHPATMVAVTTHARRGLARVVLGATAAAIVRISPVPVLVVPLR